MTILTVTELSDWDFSHLARASNEEGVAFIQRLIDEFHNGANRFAERGERLIVMEENERLIGVAGLNRDPYLNDPKIGRLRHVYVLPNARGQGKGKRLVMDLLQSPHFFDKIVLRTPEPDSTVSQFYLQCGFIKVANQEYYTHCICLK